MRRPNRGLALLLLSACCLHWTSAPAEAQKLLRWKFTPGEELKMQMVQKMKMQVSGVTTDMNQTVDMGWKTMSVNDQGVATIKQSLDRMRMNMQVPGGLAIQVDTASEEKPEGPAAQIADVFKKLTDVHFAVEMNARGEILEVTVPEDVEKVFRGLGPAGGMFNKAMLEEMTRKGAQPFPEKAVEVGDGWTNAYTMQMAPLGEMRMLTSFQYLGTEKVDGRDLDKIGMDMTMNLAQPEKKEGEAAPMPKISIAEQKAQGAFYFDSQAGRMANSEMKMHMVMKIDLGGQQLEQAIDQDVHVTFQTAK